MKSLTHAVELKRTRGCALRLCIVIGGGLWAEAFGQSLAPVILPATQMARSSEVTAYADYVTIYGKPERKTYVYQDLSLLPFRKFRLQIEAAGVSGDNRWPKLAVAFNDTNHMLKELEVNSTAFQSYDFGAFEAPVKGTLYLIFTNDYYDPATRADVNLKIRQAMLTPTAYEPVVVKGRKLTLRWERNREADLAGYRIYHSAAVGVAKTSNERVEVRPENTSHVFDVNYGRDYFFAVTAFDTAGNESALSPEIVARVLPDSTGTTSDLNGDGKCDALDKDIFKKAFGATCNDPKQRYRANADFNGDCRIDARDQVLFTQKCK